ncbi:hypothetical protein HK098_004712 [Nowakowskiella sp. JEL0407]|nr:hypothetical protein HK098_004712 [Nowakowskiella sp. JEL0407]
MCHPEELEQITDFGPNPSNLEMFIYTPADLPNPHPLLLGIHWCTGCAGAFFTETEFRKMADEYKFMVIYPSVTRDYGTKCWDVGSKESITREGGGDSQGLASMVRYAIKNFNVDTERVFVTGHSSGGMTTQMMMATYPDLFAAGAAFAGVPFTAYYPYDDPKSLWNNAAATGKIVKTPQKWGDLVRNAYPDFPLENRPKVMIWHGEDDDIIFLPNFFESIKQWTNVLSVSDTPSEVDSPETNWTRRTYRDDAGNVKVQAVSVKAGPHNVLVDGMAIYVIEFFGLA